MRGQDVIAVNQSNISSVKERRQLKPATLLTLQAYAFLLPSFLGLLVFSFLPIIAVAALSFIAFEHI